MNVCACVVNKCKLSPWESVAERKDKERMQNNRPGARDEPHHLKRESWVLRSSFRGLEHPDRAYMHQVVYRVLAIERLDAIIPSMTAALMMRQCGCR